MEATRRRFTKSEVETLKKDFLGSSLNNYKDFAELYYYKYNRSTTSIQMALSKAFGKKTKVATEKRKFQEKIEKSNAQPEFKFVNGLEPAEEFYTNEIEDEKAQSVLTGNLEIEIKQRFKNSTSTTYINPSKITINDDLIIIEL